MKNNIPLLSVLDITYSNSIIQKWESSKDFTNFNSIKSLNFYLTIRG